MSKRKELMKKCGLPETQETSHCFNDGTHQSCCMLGPKARAYADSSGNPIGKASERAYKGFTGKDPSKDDLTPWCTCFGSKVCSFYGSKFDDGTHIKFLNDMNNDKEVLVNIPNKVGCEDYARNLLNIKSHGTPGIYKADGEVCSKTEIDSIKRKDIYLL